MPKLESQEMRPTPVPYGILLLDGGGAKGFQTLGVFREVEAMLGGSLYKLYGGVPPAAGSRILRDEPKDAQHREARKWHHRRYRGVVRKPRLADPRSRPFGANS